MTHQRWSRRLAATAVLALAVALATEGCGDGLAPDPVAPGELKIQPPGFTGAAALTGHGRASSVLAAGVRAGGEGRSAIFARPAWQGSVAAVTGSHRGVADIAMDASPCSPIRAYYTLGPRNCWDLAWSGTSMAAPLLAGLVADAAQEAGHPLGVLGPALYQVHGPGDGIDDITTGTGTIAGYPARPGYDLPTGIGTASSALRFATVLARLVGRPAPQAADRPRTAAARTQLGSGDDA